MCDDLHVTVEIVGETMQLTQATRDVLRLQFSPLAPSLEPIPGVELDNLRAVAHDGDLGDVEEPFERRSLLRVNDECVVLVDEPVGRSLIIAERRHLTIWNPLGVVIQATQLPP